MLKDDVLIEAKNVCKIFRIYKKPVDRILEAFDIFRLGKHSSIFKANNNINFTLKKGEVVGIIGPNGSGKSTFLKILSGILEPTSGYLKINGRVDSLIELGAAFNPELTGYENIDFFLKIKQVNRKELKHRVSKIIDFCGLDDMFLAQPIKTYSSGMFARLAFSAAIHSDFDILIIDEVLSVGDEQFQNKCIEHMIELSKTGKGIIFVSHNLHAVKYFCDRVVRFEAGEIVDEGSNVIDIVEMYEKNIKPVSDESVIESNKTSGIVKITSTKILNQANKEVKEFEYSPNLEIKIKIDYELYEYLPGMFFGVGMRNSKGEYVNGLNTKIDKFKINDQPGKYTLILTYQNPKLYKDIYTLWSVCYNASGTVVLSDYIIKNAFEIKVSKQMCEGILFIDHFWQYDS